MVGADCPQKNKKQYVDVTREVLFEHERQCSCNGGLVNLFAPSYMMEKWPGRQYTWDV